MKFKTDENLPVDVPILLQQGGFDSTSVYEQSMVGSKDDHVIAICKQEERILITLDTDFSDIRQYPPHNYPGIIVLRLRQQDKEHVLEVMRKMMVQLARETLSGCLWIVDEEKIRIRSR